MLDDTTFHTAYTTTEPSLEGLLAFCESRPAEDVYCWIDYARCLAHQYNASIGRRYSYVDVHHRRAAEIDYQIEAIAQAEPRTFGAAAARCRSLLAGRAS